MRARAAWLLVALTAALAVTRPVVLATSDRLWSTEAVTAGFPLVDLGAVVGAAIGALIISRYPRHRVGWLFLIGQLLTELGVAAQAYGVAAVRGDLPDAPGGPPAIAVGLQLGAFPTLALLGLLFGLAPDGRWPRGRWSWGTWLSVLGLLVHAAAVASVRTDRVDLDGEVVGPADPGAQVLLLVSYVLTVVGVVVAAASLFSRLRHSDGPARERLTWITLATVLLAVTAVFTLVSVEWLQLPSWAAALPLMVAYAAVPVLTGIGILRHRLFGVDVVLDRAIVLALLSGSATLLYIAVVVALSLPPPESMTDLGLLPSLIVTTVVALVLQPARSRAARFAARLVYGEQADPYVALAEFTRELQGVPHPEQMLTGVARAIGRTVGASVVRLRVTGAAHLDRRPADITWRRDGDQGARPPDWVAPVVADRSAVVGELAVTMPPGRGLRPVERQLLVDFLTQLGQAIGNVRLGAELSARAAELVALTEQLQASRRRLEVARTRERVAFEAAIRHAVLPHLQQLPAELRRLARSPIDLPGPADAVDELVARTTQAVEALRTVTRGVFPAQLARRGLPAALATHLQDRSPAAVMAVRDWWVGRRLEPRLESTLYFTAVDLVEGLSTVHSVELTTDAAGAVARLVIVGVPAPTASTGRFRVLTDRLSVFDGSFRARQAAGREWVFELELPAAPPGSAPAGSATQGLPGAAQVVGVE